MFNALRYTEILEKAGFSREQAESTVNTLMEVMDQNLATKEDLRSEGQLIRNELRAEMQGIRTELKTEMQDLRSEMRERFMTVESDIRSLRTEIDYRLERTEFRMTVKLGTLMTVGMGVIAVLVRLH